MFIIEVIPLTILPSNVPQLLTYFFDRPLNKGSVVEVAVGNRKVNAAVASVVPLEQRKIMLKNFDFQLKKINKAIEEKALITKGQFEIARWMSRHYYAPLGHCLKTVLPPFFLKKNYELPALPDGRRVTNHELKNQDIPKPLILLTRAKETLKNIKPHIKEGLKNGGQVLIVVPEINLIKFYYEILAGDHEVSVIHSRMPIRKLFKSWQEISSGNADVIIGTRQSLFVPFKELRLIIVDDPCHEAYKSDMTPKYNTPDLAAKIAEMRSAKLISTIIIPSVNDHHSNISNQNGGIVDKIGPSRPPINVVDMIKELKSSNFSIFSRDLKNSVTSAVAGGKKVLIFSPRKGYSGVLACGNCGFSLKCPDCSVPMKVHKSPEAVMVCHRCYRTEKIPTFCPNCNSSELKPFGIAGSEKVAEELGRYLNAQNLSAPIFIFDADSADNAEKEEGILKQIKDAGPAIVVATHKIFTRRYFDSFDMVGVLNVDAMASIPDFRADERLLYQLEKLLDFEPGEMIVQSYAAESPVMSAISVHEYKEFYDGELLGREMFYYPPFSRIAKLTFKHKDRDKASYAARLLSEKMKMVIAKNQMENSVKLVGPSPAFVDREKGFYIYNLILKMPIDIEVEDILKYVPPYWSVDIDPVRTI